MANTNVNLWFAKGEDGETYTINEINKTDGKKYYCPLCGSEVVQRKGEKNAWCFAHIDKSTCSNETMYHWWVKNKLIEVGDTFKIKSDVEREYTCKEVIVERGYNLESGLYKPDLSIKTECGQTIHFEMNYSNEKRISDYIDRWIELNNIVVEVDVKTLLGSKSGEMPTFDAKYYSGKCFNIGKEDDLYYKTIGAEKEKFLKDMTDKKEDDIQKAKKDIEALDWFWSELIRYKNNEIEIEDISLILDNLDDSCMNIVYEILKKPKVCNNVLNNYMNYKKEEFCKILDFYKSELSKINFNLCYSVSVPRVILDRVEYGLLVELKQYGIGSYFFSRYIKKIGKLEEVIKNFYLNTNTVINLNPIIEKINKKFNYKSNIIKIDIKKLDLKEEDDNLLLYFNGRDYDYDEGVLFYNDIDFNSINNRSIYKLILDRLKNIGYDLPINHNKFLKVEQMANDICTKNNYEVGKWNTKFKLDNESFIVEIESYSNCVRKTYGSIELNFWKNEVLYYDEYCKLINKEKFCFNNINVETYKNMLKYIDEIKDKNKIISNEILDSFKTIKDKYQVIEKFNMDVDMESPSKLELNILYGKDKIGFSIKNNILYKLNFQVCDFNDKDSSYISNILSKIIDRQLYINPFELDNEIETLHKELNDRYAMVEGKYKVVKNIHVQYKLKLMRNSYKIDSIEINNGEMINNGLKQDIINKFSASIRKEKYNI